MAEEDWDFACFSIYGFNQLIGSHCLHRPGYIARRERSAFAHNTESGCNLNPVCACSYPSPCFIPSPYFIPSP